MGINIFAILIHYIKKKAIRLELSYKFEKFICEKLYDYYKNDIFNNADCFLRGIKNKKKP